MQRCADPHISRPRIIRVRRHQVRGRSASATVWLLRSADRPHPQVGSDYSYTVSNRQCLGPHAVKQALLHSLLQCPNIDQFSILWELAHWHFRSRLVLQTILVALDPRMVRVRKCVCLADPRTSASAVKSADPGPRISASAVRTPLIVIVAGRVYTYRGVRQSRDHSSITALSVSHVAPKLRAAGERALLTTQSLLQIT